MNNTKDNKKPSTRTGVYLPFLLFIITLFLAGTTVYLFNTPVQSKEEITTGTLAQKVTITPTVIPTPSALYPQSEPLGEQKTYFTRVTDSVKVAVKAEIASTPATPVEGTSKVILQLQAGDLWERSYVLSPEKQFQGGSQTTVINQTFDIPIQQILAFIKQVEEETQVYPRNGYILNINPVINANTVFNNESLTNDFTPVFPIKLTQRELSPIGEDVQENSTQINKNIIIPNSMEFLGISVPVMPARYATGISTIVSLFLTIWLFKLRSSGTKPVSEAQSINRRYRGRLVTASSDIIDPDMIIIRLATFKELLKLADERDKSIISIGEGENNRHICRYCIPDGNILYCYVASDEAPGTIIPQQVMNEQV